MGSSLFAETDNLSEYFIVNSSDSVKYSDKKYDTLPIIDADVVVDVEQPVNRTNSNAISFAKRVLLFSRDIITLKRLRGQLSGNSNPELIDPDTARALSAPSIESKPGIYQFAQLLFRRRLLSLLDRSDPWSKAVSRDDRIAKYYNSPSYRQDLQSNRFVKAKSAIKPPNAESMKLLDKVQEGLSSVFGKVNPRRWLGVYSRDESSNQRVSPSELNIFSSKRSSKSYRSNELTPKQLKNDVNFPNILPQRLQAFQNGIARSIEGLISEVQLKELPDIRVGIDIGDWVRNSPPVSYARGFGNIMAQTAGEILRVGEGFRELDAAHILSRDRKVLNTSASSMNLSSAEIFTSSSEKEENFVSNIMIAEESLPEKAVESEQKDVKSSPVALLFSASSKLLFIAFPISSRVVKTVLKTKALHHESKLVSKADVSTTYTRQVNANSVDYVVPQYSVGDNVAESLTMKTVDETIKEKRNDSNQMFGFLSAAVSTISGVVSSIPWPKSPIDERAPDSVSALDNEALAEYNPIESLQDKFNVPFPMITVNALSNSTSPFGVAQPNRQMIAPQSQLDESLSSTAAGTRERSLPNPHPGISIDGSLNFRVGRSQELRSRPLFIDKDGVPLPTKADFAHITSRRVAVAVAAALAVKSEQDAKEYLREIGIKPLLTAVLNPIRPESRVDAILGICRLMRQEKSLAAKVSAVPGFLNVLCDLIELPLRGFLSFKSPQDREKDLRAQYEAVALVKRMVRSSDEALAVMRSDQRLKKVLSSVVAQGELAMAGSKVMNLSADSLKSTGTSMGSTTVSAIAIKRKLNNPTIVDLNDLKTHEMARVAAWGLGGVPWKPKQPGQKGLRILSFDGGGTRGVLSIALLKELMLRVGKSSPYELFDIICGTSTGGIIAGLLGIIRTRVDQSESMYDDLIDKVFGSKSNIKLVTEQAFYDEVEFENILYRLCGDELMLDSNQNECPRVFFVSTKVNVNPPQIQLWRNYNYPPGQNSRYSGEFRVNTRMAVRATTAAPTFFTPVQFEGGLYCDGALVANNPTAIALQEAKVKYFPTSLCFNC